MPRAGARSGPVTLIEPSLDCPRLEDGQAIEAAASLTRLPVLAYGGWSACGPRESAQQSVVVPSLCVQASRPLDLPHPPERVGGTAPYTAQLPSGSASRCFLPPPVTPLSFFSERNPREELHLRPGRSLAFHSGSRLDLPSASLPCPLTPALELPPGKLHRRAPVTLSCGPTQQPP